MEGRDIVIFPDDYLPNQSHDPGTSRECPILVGGFDERIVEETICQRAPKIQGAKNEGRFEIIRLDFGERQYCVALQGFLVFNPPLESRSSKQGSMALYYAAHKEEGLLLQYLHGLTSSHDHKIWIEDYYLLTGEAVLQVSDDQHILTEATPIAPTVTPGLIHQVSTEGKPSLILIRIKGDPDWFEKWLTGRGHRFQNL